MRVFEVFSTILMAVVMVLSSSCNPKLFETFATKNQVGSGLGMMVNDGKNYWFSSHWGPVLRYDPIEKKYFKYSFNKGPNIEGIMTMELVTGQVWIGLHTLGIAVYNPEKDNFSFYNMDHGLAGKRSDGEKISKVTAIAPDYLDNKIWAGTIYSGLSYYDLVKKKWFTVKDRLVKNIDVDSIAVNESYIALTADQGVYLLNKKTNKWLFCGDISDRIKLDDIIITDDTLIFKVLKRREGTIIEYNINSQKFSTILEWDEGISELKKYKNYLIICSDKGLSFYNLSTKKIKTFNTKHGLIGNVVNAVYIEGDNIWVLTEEGISKAKIVNVLKELEEIN